MSNQSSSNLANPDTWIRLIYMILFGLLLALARLVIWVVAVLQFLLVLFSGSDNINLRNLGQGTAKWCLQALLFITFNSESKPFPFSDWPEIDAGSTPDPGETPAENNESGPRDSDSAPSADVDTQDTSAKTDDQADSDGSNTDKTT